MVDISADQITAEVTQRFRGELAAQHAAGRSAIRGGGWSNIETLRWPQQDRDVRGPAVSVPDLDVATAIDYLDVSDLGSFGDDRAVNAVLVEVWGYPSGWTRAPVCPGEGIAVPEIEAQGWARALLGPQWSPAAYRLRNIGGPYTHLFRAVALVGQDGHALAAPEDFFFGFFATELVIGADQVAVQPLLPGATTPAAEVIAASVRASSLCWQVEPSGDIAPDIEKAVSALSRMLQPKGAINHFFTLVSLRVEGRTAIIGFENTKIHRYGEERVSLPTDRDFDEGSDFYRTTVPRLPTPPHNAEEWAGQMNTILRELFATGGMGLTYY
ncbi:MULTISPECIES: hypothetical protein [unclassified Nocardia]|uniref:hypothetical protein n=1 Tax=unclassified Nocardia TaxID=2637762 RepID=UPI00278BC6F4|nr:MULTISPECIES: hypothetical protein [unclassified Nocardia]